MKKVLFDPWRRVYGIVGVEKINPTNITDYDRLFQNGFHCANCKLHFGEMPPVSVEKKPIPVEFHLGLQQRHQPLSVGS